MVARKKTSRGAGKGTSKGISTSTGPLSAPKPGDHNSHALAEAAPSEADPSSEPVYFWRPSQPKTGFLSQWWRSPFRDRSDPSRVYPTAEHYMMYQKAVLFRDPETGGRILSASHPGEVKALGRAVANFDYSVWKRERERIVREANWCKFSLPVSSSSNPSSSSREDTTPTLRDALLATGDRPLVEASPADRIWGIGFKAADAEKNRRRWGLNLLGKCLMEVREQLRLEEQEKDEAREKEKGGEEDG
ncbi:hypothetical protein F4820DRAFT_404794 [Hypoxylon rubiginosum]|uniref:Uncharacterized protein n=1 Tax=Hypoxylon rubiginosum TaxID=110542 RepID=A0ACB9ZGQ7_9PEZI|nr:hypothetical protein F4820DRAFT_404794 [Hypoxylon rubiginosum]